MEPGTNPDRTATIVGASAAIGVPDGAAFITVEYQLLLRPNARALLFVPHDLTQTEVDRITKWLRTLPIDDPFVSLLAPTMPALSPEVLDAIAKKRVPRARAPLQPAAAEKKRRNWSPEARAAQAERMRELIASKKRGRDVKPAKKPAAQRPRLPAQSTSQVSAPACVVCTKPGELDAHGYCPACAGEIERGRQVRAKAKGGKPKPAVVWSGRDELGGAMERRG